MIFLCLGAMNLQNCPVQRFIPIWLVVSGAFGAFQQITALGKKAKKKNKSDGDGDDAESGSSVGKFACFNSLVGCFQIAWFIAGKPREV